MMRDDPFPQEATPEGEDLETHDDAARSSDDPGLAGMDVPESVPVELEEPDQLDERDLESEDSGSEDMYRRLWGGTRPTTTRRRGGGRAPAQDEGPDQSTSLAAVRELDRRISALRRELSEVRREHEQVMDELRSVVSLVAEYLEALGQPTEAAPGLEASPGRP